MSLGQILTAVFGLLFAIGLAPLTLGLARLRPGPPRPLLRVGSVLLCALAFNLTFFGQELWLVIPKALTPGLHPVLFHNNHDWTGDAPNVDLLQGTGALATLVSGLVFLGVTAASRRFRVSWRLFFFWMAFQGLCQSLTQLLFGAFIPSNDVGRALGYLGLGVTAKAAVGVTAVAAMAVAGRVLAGVYPGAADAPAPAFARRFGWEMLLTALATTLLLAPFRAPRNWIELSLVPLFVNLVGVGWLVLGASCMRRDTPKADAESLGWKAPALALAVVLLLFQTILRRGVVFG